MLNSGERHIYLSPGGPDEANAGGGGIVPQEYFDTPVAIEPLVVDNDQVIVYDPENDPRVSLLDVSRRRSTLSAWQFQRLIGGRPRHVIITLYDETGQAERVGLRTSNINLIPRTVFHSIRTRNFEYRDSALLTHELTSFDHLGIALSDPVYGLRVFNSLNALHAIAPIRFPGQTRASFDRVRHHFPNRLLHLPNDEQRVVYTLREGVAIYFQARLVGRNFIEFLDPYHLDPEDPGYLIRIPAQIFETRFDIQGLQLELRNRNTTNISVLKVFAEQRGILFLNQEEEEYAAHNLREVGIIEIVDEQVFVRRGFITLEYDPSSYSERGYLRGSNLGREDFKPINFIRYFHLPVDEINFGEPDRHVVYEVRGALLDPDSRISVSHLELTDDAGKIQILTLFMREYFFSEYRIDINRRDSLGTAQAKLQNRLIARDYNIITSQEQAQRADNRIIEITISKQRGFRGSVNLRYVDSEEVRPRDGVIFIETPVSGTAGMPSYQFLNEQHGNSAYRGYLAASTSHPNGNELLRAAIIREITSRLGNRVAAVFQNGMRSGEVLDEMIRQVREARVQDVNLEVAVNQAVDRFEQTELQRAEQEREERVRTERREERAERERERARERVRRRGL